MNISEYIYAPGGKRLWLYCSTKGTKRQGALKSEREITC